MGLVRAVLVCLVLLGCVAPAHASFPWRAGDPDDYTTYRQPGGAGQTPRDLVGKLAWMYAATPAENSPLTADARELNGVRGAHLADPADVPQGWRTTTGRPDVTIAVLDSGIEWDDDGAMRDLRLKTRISTGEAPAPRSDRTTATEPGVDCATFVGAGRDLNRDGVFNLLDYACDSRVAPDPRNGVNPDLLDPQDVLIAFTDGVDDDDNGYPDDMVGWDFVDDDNDPYDDVQYGHGTGEALDSVAEADTEGDDVGTCPNCMAIHLRVGTSFIADVNRFAQAAIYAVDNDVLVIQEALGTLNKSRLGRQAIDYAWERGVTTIASAADEAAQHNNWPSSYPRVILVNSATHTNGTQSYVAFNGCTNFNSKIDLAIPSVSCSSDATGRAAGMAGLLYSAALNARAAGRLEPHPTCRRPDGEPCLLSAGEVKQLMASGILGGTPVADDVNFAQTPTGQSQELSCRPVPTTACLDPFLSAPTTRLGTSPPRSYPARRGHDQFYGYGRVNMQRTLAATDAGRVPPDVEITGPEWYDRVDPASARADVRGSVWARGRAYTCRVLIAPGGYPGEADFAPVESSACDGQTVRTAPLSGVLGTIDVAQLRAAFPPEVRATNFAGPEHGPAPDQPHSGRPNSDPYGFVVKVVVTLEGDDALAGQDRRKLFLHRDAETLPGFPRQLEGDGEASPLLADLDGDNRNELIVANSDGVVHAWRRDGSELPGWPVRTDPLPRQTGRAWRTGAVDRAYGAVIATPAAADLDGDGALEVVVADLEGKVYVLDGRGRRRQVLRSNPDFSGRPLAPFVNARRGELNRTQLGFIASPVLADLDRDDGGRLEIVAASMDRHVYAWNDDGSAVPGWPVLAVDRSKVRSIDPDTHQVRFRDGVGASLQQGAIISTPVVGDLDGPGGDGRPEVVVGTNESYVAAQDGGLNAGGVDQGSYSVLGQALSPANGRLFAYDAAGRERPGWPFRVGILQAEVLPLVGEGITGAPVMGSVRCGGATPEPAVGVIPAAGVGYLIRQDGTSCYGEQGGRDKALDTSGGRSADQPFLAAFGHPAFGELAGATAFLAPVAGLQRAADVVLPEYQGGRDQLAAWNTETGTIRPGWPADVNDLQFLTGPSIGDVDPGAPGEEIVAGTSSMDLQAFTAGGSDVPGWPKLTGDWTVANPATGSFGTLDTEDDARKVVIGLTRSGAVLGFRTEAPACSPSSWPRFHHDNANSGDARRDATPPGTITGARIDGGTLRFSAPGDDVLCGTVARYEVRTSPQPFDGASFGSAAPVPAAGAPRAPGEEQALALPASDLERYVGVRAVDDQGNVGRVALVDRGPSGGGGGGGGGGGDGAPAPGDGGRTGGPVPGAPAGGGSAGGGGGSAGRGSSGQGSSGQGSSGSPSRPARRAAACLSRRTRMTRRGVGGLRLGMSRRSLERRLRRDTGRARVVRFCVAGGGRVAAVLVRGRLRLVVSTARTHRQTRARYVRRLRLGRTRVVLAGDIRLLRPGRVTRRLVRAALR